MLDNLQGLTGDKEGFFYNLINLVMSLYQYFRDLFKYFGGEGEAPEVEPVGD